MQQIRITTEQQELLRLVTKGRYLANCTPNQALARDGSVCGGFFVAFVELINDIFLPEHIEPAYDVVNVMVWDLPNWANAPQQVLSFMQGYHPNVHFVLED